MAEEKKKDQKPKATLIKHKKEEAKEASQPKEAAEEKKKVVIVKKKVVVVKKKTAPEPPAKPTPKPEQPRKSVYKPLYRTEPRRDHRDKPRDLGSAGNLQRKPFDRRFPPRRPGTGGTGMTRRPGQPFRKDKPGGVGRPGGRGPAPAATSQEKKVGGRRFIKAKKKALYQRSKYEEHEEKLALAKKKAAQLANPVPKEISIMEVITVSDLARKMNLKASDLIAKLMSMGMMVTINQQIDSETAQILADEYGCRVKIVSLYEETVIEDEKIENEVLMPRPPIVTVMGHVDHGKTKLLDAIRTTDVVSQEHGGITQHIGAYTVEYKGKPIVFLDTPGHEAFTLMRARGAQVTDIVVLVIAADDGIMPQTIEAINHAKEAKVNIIVAINKIDLPNANLERVKKELANYDLLTEEWGGHTLCAQVSALKKTGIEELLDMIILQSEMLELKANYEAKARGKIIESRIDHGRGVVSTVLVQRGTLRVGDPFIAGIFPGKVRAMFNDKGDNVDSATPSLPVEVLGFEGVAAAGDDFQVTDNERTARQIGLKRQELKKMEEGKNVKKVTLDNLFDKIKQGELQELKVVIKGDVHGSVEALRGALERLSTAEIKLNVIHASAGAINEKDVILASASNALIIGFHVRPTAKASTLAETEKVEIKKYNIIYDAVEHIKAAMEGMLKPDIVEEALGSAEVREIFKVPKIGVIAGCMVTNGVIRRTAEVQVVRDGVEIHRGKISSLRRFKDDVREVETNFECGIGLENFNDIKVGDMLEAIIKKEVAKTLS
ncbi:MAG: translation initiation factor IF-2 [Spirochaetales bacterium]|nr:translation initiation factor IF-2 [Spirochaetales bacterium]